MPWCARSAAGRWPRGRLPSGGTEAIEQSEDELDVPSPRPPSRWPAIAALLLVILVVTGAGIWYSGRPSPCDGKFVSQLYPYCVLIPPGWTAATTQYAQGIRNTQEAFGVTLGPVQTIEVGDGTEAYAWQAAVQLDDGAIVQQRMVALVRNGVSWRITLGGDGESFDEARFALEEILATWDWNDAA